MSYQWSTPEKSTCRLSGATSKPVTGPSANLIGAISRNGFSGEVGPASLTGGGVEAGPGSALDPPASGVPESCCGT